MLIVGQYPFFVCQIRQESESSGAIGGNSVAVDDYRAVEELAEVIPVEASAIPKLLHQTRRIESILRLPKLQHHKAADASLVERSSRLLKNYYCFHSASW